MPETRLPAAFADLEPFADQWCLSTEHDRYAARLAASMDEMQAFYDAATPRVGAAVEHCNKYPLDAMPDDTRDLLYLLLSLVTVSFCVEAWRQPYVPDSGAAYLDRIVEPAYP